MAIEVEAFVVPPAAIDTFEVEVDEQVTIDNVGTVAAQLKGVLVYQRFDPVMSDAEVEEVYRLGRAWRPAAATEYAWDRGTVPVEFKVLELVGQTEFGTIRAGLDSPPSRGRFGPAGSVTEQRSCNSALHLAIEIAEAGMSLRTGGPVRFSIGGTDRIPPAGSLARAEQSTPLLNQANVQVGQIESVEVRVGELLSSVLLSA